jgi:hypothetical protein
MRPGDLVVNQEEVVTIVAPLAERPTAKDEPVRFTVGLRHKEGHIVTAAISAHRALIATREVVISISDPISLAAEHHATQTLRLA